MSSRRDDGIWTNARILISLNQGALAFEVRGATVALLHALRASRDPLEIAGCIRRADAESQDDVSRNAINLPGGVTVRAIDLS